jgi:hypothetical protein
VDASDQIEHVVYTVRLGESGAVLDKRYAVLLLYLAGFWHVR